MTAPDLWPTKANVVEAAADGKGFWKSCSGCHESNEGHPTGPYHPALQCHVGGGCFECGGIGAVWDTTDYAAMGDYLARTTPLAEALAVPEVAVLVGYAEAVLFDLDALVNNSEGVSGLHMNGEIAPWESLLDGGSFGSWLSSLEVLRATIAALRAIGEGKA